MCRESPFISPNPFFADSKSALLAEHPSVVKEFAASLWLGLHSGLH
jgi:hypothetical protein